MAKRRREKITYKYDCNISEETFTVHRKAKNPDDLMSIKAYYEMNPEMDDRPDDIKKKLGVTADSTVVPPSTEE